MKKVKLMLIRMLLYCKRLIIRPSFIVIIALIPVLALALGLASDEKQGIVSVALAAEDYSDSVTLEVMSSLKEGNVLIRFIDCDSPVEAEKLVLGGKADGAWIFHSGLGEFLRDYTEGNSKGEKAVRIIEREDSVFLMLARERLYSKLYPYCAFDLYDSFLENETEFSEEERLSYYRDAYADGDLFEFAYTEPDVNGNETQDSYLLSPLRGLFSILMLLCALSGTLLYIKDSEQGVFSLLPLKKRVPLAFLCQAAPLLIIAPEVLLGLKLSGLWVGAAREFAVMGSYIFVLTGFCLLLRRLCRSAGFLSALAPAVVIISILLCPIFIEVRGMRLFQMLLPPFYPLMALYDNTFVYLSLLSGAVAAGLYLVICRITRRD